MAKKKGQYIQLSPIKISNIKEISPGAFVISFPRTFDFHAGQVVAIGLHADDDPRVYSIASGIRDADIDILFTEKSDGYLTPILAKMKPGSTIWVSPPFGSFLGIEEPAVWIAAGTGVAPFRSMLRSGLSRDKQLIYGGRYQNSFYFGEEFIEAFGNDFTRCCSQETGPGLYHGRVTKYLEEIPGLPKDKAFFLCGSAEMVIACREILLIKGVPFMNIFSEVYF